MPLKDGSYKGVHLATRRKLLGMLKMRGGGLSAQEMAGELGTSVVAVRQHMSELESSGDVLSTEKQSARGRPAKIWRLTERASRHFPDRHRDLVLDLLQGVGSVLGEEARDRVLEERARDQARAYLGQMRKGALLRDRVGILADARSDEGYMAETSERADGSIELVENHCPIRSAASACGGLCSRELEVFARVLGPECSVERVEHLLSGGSRCAYIIRSSQG